MAKNAITGANTIWTYIWEDKSEYAQDPGVPSDTNYKIFGANESLDSADRENNPERMHRPFRRGAETIIESAFDGSWGADFTLTNTWWMQFFYGEPQVTGSGPYTHTYTFQPDQVTAADQPKSAHLIEETHYPDGSTDQSIYIGAVSGSVDIDTSTEDVVNCSISGNYSTEKVFQSGNLPYGSSSNGLLGSIDGQPDLVYRPMHFGNSTLKADLDSDDTAELLSLVQDASVGLEGNLEMVHELGTRFAVAPQYMAFEPDISYTRLVDSEIKREEQRQAYGSTTVSEPQETLTDADIKAELEFDAGTSTTNAMTVKMKGAFPDSFSRNNVGDPAEAIEDDIDRMVTDVNVVVQSDESTAL